MKLSEIKALTEADENTKPAELKDIVQLYPTKARQAILAMSKKGRVLYNGKPLFDVGGDFSNLFHVADEYASRYVKELEFEKSIPLDIELEDDKYWESYDFEIRVDDAQEVYLGYRPSDNCLYIGYDVWLDENDFNENWDKQFKKNLGEEFDNDNEQHEKIFNKAWEYYKKHSANDGVLFKLVPSGQGFKAYEELKSSDLGDKGGMFYEGIHRTPQFKTLGLVDIRLD